nr:hypothetical protein [Tanacetum cinerariifolium]
MQWVCVLTGYGGSQKRKVQRNILYRKMVEVVAAADDDQALMNTGLLDALSSVFGFLHSGFHNISSIKHILVRFALPLSCTI